MKKLILIILILGSCYNSSTNSKFIEEFISKNPLLLESLKKNEIQVKLTVIDENEIFSEYEYNIDEKKYFYPASTVKLPIALLALEKLNENENISIDTPFMLEDDTLKTTIKKEIEKVFILSDNQANNRLFEFLGQDYINKKLKSKGFKDSKIFHRLSTNNSSNLDGKVVNFFLEDSIVSFRNNNRNIQKLKIKNLKKGEGYIDSSGKLVLSQMDFSEKNYISIPDLHRVIKILFFPEKFKESERFNLSENQKHLLFDYMSGYPIDFGYNSDDFPYYFGKFFIYGDQNLEFDENIKIYNKVGLAYGQLSDVAYIKSGDISFILTATINVNTNKIYNDDEYDYDEIGFPFLAEISREILNRLSYKL